MRPLSGPPYGSRVPSDHLEIGTRFDGPLSFATPEPAVVDGVASVDAPVEHLLEADYFDTEDLRPATARITLRRRTGGPDDGWHVELPTSRDARRDVARAAKRTQRLLGGRQDVVVAGQRCRRLAVTAHAAGEPGFTYGLLLGRAEARARDAEQAFDERWPALAHRLGG